MRTEASLGKDDYNVVRGRVIDEEGEVFRPGEVYLRDPTAETRVSVLIGASNYRRSHSCSDPVCVATPNVRYSQLC